MKKNLFKQFLFIGVFILSPIRGYAIGWETFIPDWVVFAAFDASNEEIQNAVTRDNILHTYMDRVMVMQKEYQIITHDLIDNARYAYGECEDGSFSVANSIENSPMSSLKQFKNLFRTITNTVSYYTKLTGFLCKGHFTTPALKAQTLECLLTQGYEAYIILEEYWSLKKEELQEGRIIQRSILWYIDTADNMNKRLLRINNKLYTQVRIVNQQNMMDKQDMEEWIHKRAEEKVKKGIKDIIG